MSLKWFHLVFIAASVALSLALAVWAFYNGSPILGVCSLAMGIALLLYRTRFIRTAQRIGLK